MVAVACVGDETGGQNDYASHGHSDKHRHREDVRGHEDQRDVEQRRCDIEVEVRIGDENHAAHGNGGQPGNGV
ncbi:hypothetical protein D3C79_1083550 [compost metagenome]